MSIHREETDRDSRDRRDVVRRLEKDWLMSSVIKNERGLRRNASTRCMAKEYWTLNVVGIHTHAHESNHLSL